MDEIKTLVANMKVLRINTEPVESGLIAPNSLVMVEHSKHNPTSKEHGDVSEFNVPLDVAVGVMIRALEAKKFGYKPFKRSFGGILSSHAKFVVYTGSLNGSDVAIDDFIHAIYNSAIQDEAMFNDESFFNMGQSEIETAFSEMREHFIKLRDTEQALHNKVSKVKRRDVFDLIANTDFPQSMNPLFDSLWETCKLSIDARRRKELSGNKLNTDEMENHLTEECVYHVLSPFVQLYRSFVEEGYDQHTSLVLAAMSLNRQTDTFDPLKWGTLSERVVRVTTQITESVWVAVDISAVPKTKRSDKND